MDETPDEMDTEDMAQVMHESNEMRVNALEEASGHPGSLENAFDALKILTFLEQIAYKLEISDVAMLDFEGRRAGMLNNIEEKFAQMKEAREAAERQQRLAGGGVINPGTMPIRGPRGL